MDTGSRVCESAADVYASRAGQRRPLSRIPSDVIGISAGNKVWEDRL